MDTKSFKQKLIKAIKSPKSVLHYVFYKFIMFIRAEITEKLYLKLLFYNNLGYWPNIDNPTTFSEKLQWLKLYDHNPEYTIMADKVKAKEWVAERIGKEHIIPTIGVWDKAEDIDFNSLPEKFVIKCNHNSGTGMYICKDKTKMDENCVRKGLAKGLKEDYYAGKLEWPYKNIPRRIIAEKFLEVNKGENLDLPDYKFFCFNGEPEFCQVISGRNDIMSIDFFDKNWIHQPFHEPKIYPFAEIEPSKPIGYEKMISIARQLAKGIPFVRIDLYNLNGHIYFGEITFFPTAGFGGFSPDEWDKKFGDLIVLPNKNNL